MPFDQARAILASQLAGNLDRWPDAGTRAAYEQALAGCARIPVTPASMSRAGSGLAPPGRAWLPGVTDPGVMSLRRRVRGIPAFPCARKLAVRRDARLRRALVRLAPKATRRRARAHRAARRGRLRIRGPQPRSGQAWQATMTTESPAWHFDYGQPLRIDGGRAALVVECLRLRGHPCCFAGEVTAELGQARTRAQHDRAGRSRDPQECRVAPVSSSTATDPLAGRHRLVSVVARQLREPGLVLAARDGRAGAGPARSASAATMPALTTRTGGLTARPTDRAPRTRTATSSLRTRPTAPDSPGSGERQPRLLVGGPRETTGKSVSPP